MGRFTLLTFRSILCGSLLVTTTIAPAAPPGTEAEPQDAATTELRESFLKMCDLAVIEFHKEITTFGDRENADPTTHHMPFFEDAHGVRALAVAYDMTGDCPGPASLYAPIGRQHRQVDPPKWVI